MISTVTSGELYRGPRPKPADFGMIRVGFGTVISLEGLREDAKELVELRPTLLVSRPISFWQIYATGISSGYLLQILRVIAVSSTPVLVHCEHGEDRTGLVVAAYRVRACGWSKERAMQEALAYGYRDWLNFGLNKTWRAF